MSRKFPQNPIALIKTCFGEIVSQTKVKRTGFVRRRLRGSKYAKICRNSAGRGNVSKAAATRAISAAVPWPLLPPEDVPPGGPLLAGLGRRARLHHPLPALPLELDRVPRLPPAFLVGDLGHLLLDAVPGAVRVLDPGVLLVDHLQYFRVHHVWTCSHRSRGRLCNRNCNGKRYFHAVSGAERRSCRRETLSSAPAAVLSRHCTTDGPMLAD
jgi:hypothetical protein